MSTTIEKEVIRKISDVGFTVPKAKSLAEASEEDLGALFASLITVYDTSWVIDTSKKGKHVKGSLMRYLRLLDLSHLIPSADSFRPGNPAIVRCLSALTQKLDDKYGNRLQLRVRQTLKPKLSKPRPAPSLQVTKPDDEHKEAPRTPVRTPTLPKTPGSAHVKLLNGQPIVPGSELRGRELARSPPPQGSTITPHVTRSATKRTPSHQLGDGSPLTKSKRLSHSKPSTPLKIVMAEDSNPQKQLQDCASLEPKITDNIIPTGRQLGRTPPSSQESVASNQDVQQDNEYGSMGSQYGQNGQPDKLATILDFKEDSSQDEDSTGQGSSEEGPIEMKPSQEVSIPQLQTEVIVKKSSVKDEEDLGRVGLARKRSVGNNSIIIPALQTESTPVALSCPENLHCDENDLEFLQIQENIKRLKALEKENTNLTKQLGEQAYKKDLLTAEYEEVKHDATHVEDKIHKTRQVIRQALVDQTNGSPSVLAGSTKKALLTGVHLKMAARASRLQAQVDKENAARKEANDTLSNTLTLQAQHAKLEKVVQRLPVAVQRAEEELESVQEQLTQSQPTRSSSGQGVDHSRRTIHRLKVLRDRIELAKQRKALLRQMNLR